MRRTQGRPTCRHLPDHLSRAGPDGTIVGASKIARDITDRKRLEAERKEADRRKDEFLAILAHELRNPLAPVRNAAHYVKTKGSHVPELARPLEMIERQVAQMSRLIDDLLDVSRISRGVLGIRPERVACAKIVSEAVDACRSDIHAKGQSLETNVPSEPIMLWADRERLVQVLCNVLGNAAKYTPAGGHIVLGARVVGDALELSVRDDGVGIPLDKLTEIFDLFTRVDASFDRESGLGIGLTLVRQLVELHGGVIEARSDRARPRQRIRPDAADPRHDRPRRRVQRRGGRLRGTAPDPRRGRQPRRGRNLRMLLQLSGHEVHTAFDGEEASLAPKRSGPTSCSSTSACRRRTATRWRDGSAPSRGARPSTSSRSRAGDRKTTSAARARPASTPTS